MNVNFFVPIYVSLFYCHDAMILNPMKNGEGNICAINLEAFLNKMKYLSVSEVATFSTLLMQYIFYCVFDTSNDKLQTTKYETNCLNV